MSPNESIFFRYLESTIEVKAVLVIIHGFGEHGGRYLELARFFQQKGFTVFIPDHLGHGQSSGKRGYIRSWLDYRTGVDAVLEEVRKTHSGLPVFLYGHSMGGLIVLDYGLNCSEGVSGIVSSAPALTLSGVSKVLRLLARVLSKVWPSVAIRAGLEKGSISRDPSINTEIDADPLCHGLGTPRLSTEMERIIQKTLATGANWQLPLLLIHGGADRITSPEVSRHFFESLPHGTAEFQVFEEALHNLHQETNKEEVFSLVLKWILQYC